MATLCSALTLIFLGQLIDRWPLRRFLLFVSLGLIVACLSIAAGLGVVSLLLGLYLLRLFGQGLFPHTGVTTMARYFEKNRGKALSIATCGVPVGEVILPALAIALAAWFGWRISWLIFALSVPILLLPVSFGLLRRAAWRDVEEDDKNDTAEKPRPAWRILLSDYRFWFALPVVLAAPFMLTAIFVHQDVLLEQKSWTPALLASAFILYGIVHWLSSILTGVMVDKFSAVSLVRFFNIPLICALLLAANIDGSSVIFGMMFFLGLAIGSSSPILGALWAEVYGTSRIGGIRSLVSFFVILSTSISPLLFGVCFDRGIHINTSFNLVSCVLILANMMLLFSYRR